MKHTGKSQDDVTVAIQCDEETILALLSKAASGRTMPVWKCMMRQSEALGRAYRMAVAAAETRKAVDHPCHRADPPADARPPAGKTPTTGFCGLSVIGPSPLSDSPISP